MLKNKKTLIISLSAGAAATIVFYIYSAGLLNMFKSNSKKVDKSQTVETRKYVVAAVDLEIRTMLTPEMMIEAEAPVQYVHQDAIASIKSATGRVTMDRILKGEVVMERNLRDSNSPSELSFVVPDGKRAITVGATVTSAVGNMLKPGDGVDVVVYLDEKIAGDSVSFILLRNMLVLATDTEIYGNEGKESTVKKAGKSAEKDVQYKSVTLSATPEECVKLSLAESIGVVKLTLYSGEETEAGEIEVAALRDMIDGLHKKEEPAPTPDIVKKTTSTKKPAKSNATSVEIKRAAPAPVAVVALPTLEPDLRMVQIMRGLDVETLEFEEGKE